MKIMTYSFNELKITSLESRRASEIEKLIKYHKGIPRVAPSMKELPFEEADSVWEFAKRLFAGETDMVVLLTGVGTTFLSERIISRFGEKKYVEALRKTVLVARGPKPVAALKKYELKPDVTIPEPNTWRDILSKFDEEYDIRGKNIVVQEYGISNRDLIKELKNRGASVLPVTIYKWGLPDDTGPLADAIRSIADGNEDVVLFTSSQQIVNMFDLADEFGLRDRLFEGLGKTVIGSIGPTTTETLSRYGLTADYEPDSPKMGNLVRETARVSAKLVHKKKTAGRYGIDTAKWKRIDMRWQPADPTAVERSTHVSQFIKACRGERTDYTPVWIMRQAGRFLREYRDIRSRVTFLELCKAPELAAEVTLMAAEKLDVDAAIIFSDILLILETLGLNIEFSKNDGPIIKNIVRSERTLESLSEFSPEGLDFVYEAIKLTKRALPPQKALIGFAGAPFTVASYAIEGGASRNYINTKQLMFQNDGFWDEFMTRLTSATSQYLIKQIEAGADAVQIFDSWIGCLSPGDYKNYVFPHMKQLVSSIPAHTPVIMFGTGTSSLLEMIRDTGCTVVGLDWRVDISEAWKRIGNDTAIQGNMDPVKLFSTTSYVKQQATEILDKVNGRPGFIFNLGHGVLPRTPVENVLKLVDTVHEYSNKSSR